MNGRTVTFTDKRNKPPRGIGSNSETNNRFIKWIIYNSTCTSNKENMLLFKYFQRFAHACNFEVGM